MTLTGNFDEDYTYKNRFYRITSSRTNYYTEQRIVSKYVYDLDSAMAHYPLRFYTGRQRNVAYIDTFARVLTVENMLEFRTYINSKEGLEEKLKEQLHLLCEHSTSNYLVYDYVDCVLLYNVREKKANLKYYGYYTRDLDEEKEYGIAYLLLTKNNELVKISSNSGVAQLIYIMQNNRFIKTEGLKQDTETFSKFIYAYARKLFPRIEFTQYLKERFKTENLGDKKNIENTHKLHEIENEIWQSLYTQVTPEKVTDTSAEKETDTDEDKKKVSPVERLLTKPKEDDDYELNVEYLDLTSHLYHDKDFEVKDRLYYITCNYELGIKYRSMFYHPLSDTILIYTEEPKQTLPDDFIKNLIDYDNVVVVRVGSDSTNNKED